MLLKMKIANAPNHVCFPKNNGISPRTHVSQAAERTPIHLHTIVQAISML